MILSDIEINARKIGHEQPCFIVAEAGVNHNGDIAMARKLIDVAVEAGADAVKFQTFKADALAIPGAPKAEYQRETTGADESQLEMLRRLELTREQHKELSDYCRAQEIVFLSSPFDERSCDELVELGLGLLKIGSGELTNLPFLAHVARQGVPIILSTGMARIGEVEQAVEVFRNAGNDRLVLLHCVSSYPANPADCNLTAMHTMRSAFGLPVGFSDHTLGVEVSVAAVALGACVIEKHFTLNRALPGPDHRASLEPKGLMSLVHGIRAVESALGDGRKIPVESERNTAEVARKSIVAIRQILPGAVISADALALSRPGTGLPAEMMKYVVGSRSRMTIPKGALIAFEMIS